MHTWDYILSIHGVFILDEAEAVHELDFLDDASTMMAKVFLNVGFGDWTRAVSG